MNSIEHNSFWHLFIHQIKQCEYSHIWIFYHYIWQKILYFTLWFCHFFTPFNVDETLRNSGQSIPWLARSDNQVSSFYLKLCNPCHSNLIETLKHSTKFHVIVKNRSNSHCIKNNILPEKRFRFQLCMMWSQLHHQIFFKNAKFYLISDVVALIMRLVKGSFISFQLVLDTSHS